MKRRTGGRTRGGGRVHTLISPALRSMVTEIIVSQLSVWDLEQLSLWLFLKTHRRRVASGKQMKRTACDKCGTWYLFYLIGELLHKSTREEAGPCMWITPQINHRGSTIYKGESCLSCEPLYQSLQLYSGRVLHVQTVDSIYHWIHIPCSKGRQLRGNDIWARKDVGTLG